MTGFPAAQYIRMSTDHQRFSLVNQRAAIETYARDHGYEVIETYEDPGRSGLTIKGRPGLQRLIADVRSGNVAFRTILVLDVSRWGRFQDTDQAAHYEFMCREAGVAVLYCGEPWAQDAGPVASIMKHMKRVMAAEYSRELSTKVSRAQRQQAMLGYKQGGYAPLGLRRLVVDQHGQPRMIINIGERKALNTDRVVFAPGSKSEIALARRIFEFYADERWTLTAIANWLNKRRKRHPNGSEWTTNSIRHLLSNEIYIGQYVFGRRFNNLGEKLPAPEGSHVRVKVLAPLIPEALFERTQRRLRETKRRYFSDDEIKAGMIRLFRENGEITNPLIEACAYLPRVQVLAKRYGTLTAAYRAMGFEMPDRWLKKADGQRYTDEDLLNELRRIHAERGYLSMQVIKEDAQSPNHQYFIRRFGGLGKAFRLAGFPPITSSYQLDGARRRREREQSAPASPRNPARNRNADGTFINESQLLDMLRGLLAEHGYITLSLINADASLPSATYFRRRLGNMLSAYKRIGYLHTKREVVQAAHDRRMQGARSL